MLFENSITDISPLSGLLSLGLLDLGENSVVDLTPLSGLLSIAVLGLESNRITDVSGLEGLNLLSTLILDANSQLRDIQPLFDNDGLGTGATVHLRDTNVLCVDVEALRTRGATVVSECS